MLLVKDHLVVTLAEDRPYVGLLVAAHEAKQRAAALPHDESPLHGEEGLAHLHAMWPKLADGSTPQGVVTIE